MYSLTGNCTVTQTCSTLWDQIKNKATVWSDSWRLLLIYGSSWRLWGTLRMLSTSHCHSFLSPLKQLENDLKCMRNLRRHARERNSCNLTVRSSRKAERGNGHKYHVYENQTDQKRLYDQQSLLKHQQNWPHFLTGRWSVRTTHGLKPEKCSTTVVVSKLNHKSPENKSCPTSSSILKP